MTDDELYRLSLEKLQDKEVQKKVFKKMLLALERHGNCSYAFHRLAFVLFGDELET